MDKIKDIIINNKEEDAKYQDPTKIRTIDRFHTSKDHAMYYCRFIEWVPTKEKIRLLYPMERKGDNWVPKEFWSKR